MDQTLVALAAANGGYLFRHQLNDLGVSDRSLAGAVRGGEMVRIRHGVYVPMPIWVLADATERFAIRTRSVLDRLGSGVVATHTSGAVLLGLDIYEADLSDVHVTRLDGRSGRREAGVIYHENAITDADLTTVNGRPVATVLRAVLEVCSDLPVESGMVSASSALRRGDVTKPELEEAVKTLRHWPGASRARLAVRLSDGRLDSVGEVRSLHMMWTHGLPHPQLQVALSSGGRLIGRSDFGWLDWCHVGEFDGMVKYGRLNRFTEEPGRALEQEKIREDAIRSLNLGMSRWTWTELEPASRPRTAERIRSAMETSRRLYSRERRVFAG